jgi:hypothetical protein
VEDLQIVLELVNLHLFLGKLASASVMERLLNGIGGIAKF